MAYRNEQNLVLYAEEHDMPLLANLLNRLGMTLVKEGDDHFVAETPDGSFALHVCPERRHDSTRLHPDEPGTHGLWKFIKTRIVLGREEAP